jgi:large subunit ribosomal protein L10
MMSVGKIYRDKVVKTIKDGIDGQEATIVVNYNKVSSGELSGLRKTLRQKKARMCASRNSLVKVALKGTDYSSLAEDLNGQTALIFTSADAAEIAKILVKFSEKNETFLVCGGVFQKGILTRQAVKRLSDLPSKEVVLGQILGALKAPATRLARSLNSKQTDLILILKQLSEKKGGN